MVRPPGQNKSTVPEPVTLPAGGASDDAGDPVTGLAAKRSGPVAGAAAQQRRPRAAPHRCRVPRLQSTGQALPSKSVAKLARVLTVGHLEAFPGRACPLVAKPATDPEHSEGWVQLPNHLTDRRATRCKFASPPADSWRLCRPCVFTASCLAMEDQAIG